MAKFRVSGNVIISNQSFATDAPIVTWVESGWNGASSYCIPTVHSGGHACRPVAGGQQPYDGPNLTQRYSLRPALRSYGNHPDKIPLSAVKSVIRQFVVHHDGCASAEMCFEVLHNERGLSCHFLIDNDGTIYQTLDLALAAWHATHWNVHSIGVEMCNRGDPRLGADYYSSGKHGPKRDIVGCQINGHKIAAFDYTKAQLEAFSKLARALQRLLPNIPLEFPQKSPGVQAWETLPYAASMGFSGYIGHYHLIPEKWDPGPFDFKSFIRGLRGAFCLPIFTKEPNNVDEVPKVPEQGEDLKARTEELHKANEQKADGGFFPVGPWGEQRLWHGGIHLTAKKDARIFAPFPGRLVAARMGASSTIGSNNFVLLRHEMTLGESKVEFYSLYMHLADELKADKPVAWMAKPDGGWAKQGKGGEVVLLDEPIEGGAVIAHVGVAGPAELAKSQVHVSFFSASELFAGMSGSPWEVIDGLSGGRFCDVPRINDLIDSNKNGKLERAELAEFYSGGGGQQTRNFVTLHVSEWTFDPPWSDALRVPADFKHLTPAQIDELVADQITPGLWWDARVAQHCRLPLSGEVYHYNPVAFIAFFNQKMLEAAALNPDVKIDPADTSAIPSTITDDFGDKDGSSMRSSVDVAEDPCNKTLGLPEMVQGFDAPECVPQ